MKVLKKEIYDFIDELHKLLNSYPIELWEEGCKDFVDYACFLNPSAWEVGLDEVRKVKRLLEFCSELKKVVNEFKKEIVEEGETPRI